MLVFFFFNDTATTEIYTLSLHDALPICIRGDGGIGRRDSEHRHFVRQLRPRASRESSRGRSEEHTSELQSQSNLVCRLLLEKKKNTPSRYRSTKNKRSPPLTISSPLTHA